MHMQGEPPGMQVAPGYEDVLAQTKEFLACRLATCLAAGIHRECIVVDPGFGFGKSLKHNLRLLAQLHEFESLGCPVLVGLSRKSLLQSLTGRAVGERLAGSVALAALAACNGALIVRAHDVAATLDAVRVGAALRAAGTTGETGG